MTPEGLTRYEYETDDEAYDERGQVITGVKSDALGRLVKMIEKPVIDADDDPDPGGPVKAKVTRYQRNADGRLGSQRTIRGSDDLDPFNPPTGDGSDEDYVETWTYEDGLVKTYTDARGLTTTYTYDAQRRPKVVVVTDQGVEVSDTADDEVRSAGYAYDSLGYVDTVTVYNGQVGGSTISVQDLDYDATGLLRQEQIRDTDMISVLSRTQYEYAPDGVVTAVIDGNGVRSESTYDKAGLLIQMVEATGEEYYSLYTGQPESVEQTTEYTYYTDGRPRQTHLLNHSHQTMYLDPENRTQWTTTDGVSDSKHQISGSAITDFSDDGTQVLKTEALEFGRQYRRQDLGTGAEVEVDQGDPRSGLPTAVQEFVGRQGQTMESSTKLDGHGRGKMYQAPGVAPVEFRHDELDHLTERADLSNGRVIFESSKINATGDVMEQTEVNYSLLGFLANSLLPFLPSNWFSTTYATTYEYDEQGRLRKTIDPLTDKYPDPMNPGEFIDPGPEDENGAVPATVGYSFEVIGTQLRRKVTSTSRAGVSTSQWLDGMGRVVQEKNEFGGTTSYKYDTAGNLIEQEFSPAPDDNALAHKTTFQYDALGRQRLKIEHGAQPSFTATDYFLPGADRADGWNEISFIPLEITNLADFKVSDSQTFALPEGLTDAAHLAARTRLDSLGNPYYIQQPDPSDDPNDTPTALITYNYVPELQVTAVTTRLAVAENVAPGTSPTIDSDYPHTRVTRTVTNAAGQTILEAARLSSFDKADYSQVNDAIASGTLDPDTVATNDIYEQFIDPKDLGFVALVRNEYDPASGQRTKSFDGKDNETAYVYYEDTGKLRKVTDAEGGETYYQYDFHSNLSLEVDPRGGQTKYTYDTLGRRTKVRDALNHETTYHYQTGGDYVEETNARGFATTTWESPANRTKVVADAEGGSTLYKYDSAGKLIEKLDALGRSTKYEYDELGRKIKETLPDPDLEPGGANGPLPTPITRYEYDVRGNLVKVVQVIDDADPTSDRVTEYGYDLLNRRIKETQPDPDLEPGGANGPLPPPVIQTAYNAFGEAIKITGTNLGETSYQFDGLGRLITETLPDPDKVPGGSDGPLAAPVIEYAYDAAGNRVGMKDAVGSITTWLYDKLNRPVEERDPLYNASHGTLAAAVADLGNPKGSCDTNTTVLHVTLSCYDEVGNVKRRVTPTGPAGPVVTAVTSYDYDLLNRLVEVTDAENGVTTYAYDEVGNRVAIKDPVGNITTWLFDPLNRVEEERDPLYNQGQSLEDAVAALAQPSGASCQTDTGAAHVTLSCYDTVGNLTKRIDRNDKLIEYEYDSLNRPKKEEWLEGAATVHTLDFVYDSAGYLFTASDADSTVTLSYDNLGRVTSALQDVAAMGFDVVLTSQYNDAGEREKLAATIDGVDDFVNDYQHDQLGRVTRIEQHDVAGGSTVSEKRVDLAYDATGQFDTITRYADLAGSKEVVFADYTFDVAHRLTGLTYWQSSERDLLSARQFP